MSTTSRKYRYGGSNGVQVDGEIIESYTQVTVATTKAREKKGKMVFMTKEQELALAKKDAEQPTYWWDSPSRVHALNRAIQRLMQKE
jgi:hypothetical protein